MGFFRMKKELEKQLVSDWPSLCRKLDVALRMTTVQQCNRASNNLQTSK